MTTKLILKRAASTRTCAALAAALMCFADRAALAEPGATVGLLNYSGRLEDPRGVPLAGTREIELILWDDQASVPLCTTGARSVALSDGRFSLALPAECNTGIQTQINISSEVVVNGQSLGKSAIFAVPRAIVCERATHATATDSATGELAATIEGLSTSIAALEATVRTLQTSSADRPQAGRIGFDYMSIPGFPLSSTTSGGRQYETYVRFTTPFSTPPQVVAAIAHLDTNHNMNTRLTTAVTSVDLNGFTLHLGTWGDSQVFGVSVNWVALPAL
jgi:hypothetical protein